MNSRECDDVCATTSREEPDRIRTAYDATLDVEPVLTSDGQWVDGLVARKIARRYYVLGFCGLPLFWGVNVWMFFPCLLRQQQGNVGRSQERRDGSMSTDVVVMCAFHFLGFLVASICV